MRTVVSVLTILVLATAAGAQPTRQRASYANTFACNEEVCVALIVERFTDSPAAFLSFILIRNSDFAELDRVDFLEVDDTQFSVASNASRARLEHPRASATWTAAKLVTIDSRGLQTFTVRDEASRFRFHSVLQEANAQVRINGYVLTRTLVEPSESHGEIFVQTFTADTPEPK